LRSTEPIFTELMRAENLPTLHTINFGERESEAIQCMKMIARVGRGTYFAYNPDASGGDGDGGGGGAVGPELQLIADEALKARESLSVVEKRIRQQQEQHQSAPITTTKKATTAPKKSADAPWSKTNRTQELREKALKGGGAATAPPVDDTKRLLAIQTHTLNKKASAATDDGKPNQSSRTWLDQNGIAARKLNFYDVFVRYAFLTRIYTRGCHWFPRLLV
jgi:hypothetical protein